MSTRKHLHESFELRFELPLKAMTFYKQGKGGVVCVFVW